MESCEGRVVWGGEWRVVREVREEVLGEVNCSYVRTYTYIRTYTPYTVEHGVLLYKEHSMAHATASCALVPE